MSYQPRPLDTSHVTLPPELERLRERLAENAHDVWARQRMAEGWKWGAQRDDQVREHPCLVPYDELPESEKEYDRNTAMETLKAIMALGCAIVPTRPPAVSQEADAAESLLAMLRAARSATGDAAAKKKGELAVLAETWRGRDPDGRAWRSSPEPYRYVGERLLKLGEAPLAKEVARAGLEHTRRAADGREESPWAKDVTLRLIAGSAYARTASPEQAQQVLGELYEELKQHAAGTLDEQTRHTLQETLGLLGRTYKDQALAAADEQTQATLWRQSRELYDRAYRLTGGYWTGINVATLARLGGDEARSREVAEAVRSECLAELERLPPGHDDRYWVLATLGEAALDLGDFREAATYYRAAWQAAPREHGNLISTRRHARWLLTHWKQDLAELDAWLPIPKVVVFAGHMLDLPDRKSERFPDRLAGAVREAIREWLAQQNALIGFSSAACGSDILFQEALHELGGEAYVVLPYEETDFETDSVRIFHDPRDANWADRFRAVLNQATQVVKASPQKMEFGGISYDYANLLLHGLATVRAAAMDHTPLLGLAVWDGGPGDGPGGTASVVGRWHTLGLPVHCVDLSRLPPDPAPRLAVVKDTRAPKSSDSHLAPEPTDTRVMAMLFGDAVNFSKLTEEQVPRFVQHFLAPIAELIHARYEQATVVRNTWGDGLYLVFSNVRDAGCCALEICQFVTNCVWKTVGLPEALNVRIALHAGPVFGCRDPVTGQNTYTGTHVSRAARLEPKTPPGQVYASEAFAALVALEEIEEFHCEYVKQLEWAKHYGTFPTYVLVPRRQSR